MKKQKKEVWETLVGVSQQVNFLIWICLKYLKNNIFNIILILCIICLTISVNKPRYIDRTETVVKEKMTIVYVDAPDKIIYTDKEDITEIVLDVDYLARCIEAEAGNQGKLGKVYVTDCILNRFENGNYSNITDVINEPGQFACVSNGSINRVKVNEETYEIIEEELQNRTNTEILYFRAGGYHSFGTPCFQYQDHFFSK